MNISPVCLVGNVGSPKIGTYFGDRLILVQVFDGAVFCIPADTQIVGANGF